MIAAGSFFQNCGKAGFDSGLGFSGMGITGTEDPRFSSAPMPLDINVNTVSYMSCPMAGSNSSSVSADPMSSPYYTFRVGAFDNSTLPLVGANGNKAGINFVSSAVNFAKSMDGSGFATNLRDYAMGSKYTVDRRAVVALIAQNRTKDFLAFTSAATSLTDILSSTELANYIAKQSVKADGSTNKINYFPSISGNRQEMVASLMIGSSMDNSDRLRVQMNNHYLMIGTTKSENTGAAADIVRGLDSPDGDVTKRIYGRALKLNFQTRTSNQWPLMTNVREYSLNPSNYTSGPVVPQDLTTSEGQVWGTCFSLQVVREIDRKYYINASGSIIAKTQIRKNTAAATEKILLSNEERVLLEDKMYKYYQSTATPVPLMVIHKACPPMNPALIDPTSLSYDSTVATKYQVARRFLLSQYWEINTETGYDCAVPTAAATQSGFKCSVSGDDDPTYFMAYPAMGEFSDPIVGCGTAECAPFVSFCYRAQ